MPIVLHCCKLMNIVELNNPKLNIYLIVIDPGICNRHLESLNLYIFTDSKILLIINGPITKDFI